MTCASACGAGATGRGALYSPQVRLRRHRTAGREVSRPKPPAAAVTMGSHSCQGEGRTRSLSLSPFLRSRFSTPREDCFGLVPAPPPASFRALSAFTATGARCPCCCKAFLAPSRKSRCPGRAGSGSRSALPLPLREQQTPSSPFPSLPSPAYPPLHCTACIDPLALCRLCLTTATSHHTAAPGP